MTRFNSFVLAALLALPLAAQAGSEPESIRGEIKREMANSRAEVRAELAKARAELESEDLSVGNGISFGKRSDSRRDADLPAAHITPAGAFVVDGKTVPTTAEQRRLLLAYRRQVLDVARAGIDVGEKAAMMALDVTDTSLFSLIAGAMTGSLERRIEKVVKQELQPLVATICSRLPAVMASEQALAGSLPQFQPYARLAQDDLDDCERELRRDLALR
ncbi:hypothetical protein [Stenotrophomonas sp. Marseille-Q4652]|uniref:hypothetical protein n=1 Tax=Stenotrophomonas sp. Marseille-Q4652 TaxID=2866595 RepID=UPI001CE3E24C|nr:hypothetical protein [Stenotrophomonas sp. Marseille-Q4652]